MQSSALTPVKLGPFNLEHPFVLAPMAGITNSPFRRLMRKMKSAMMISELISANGLKYGGEKTAEMLRFHEDERILGLQIFGEDEPSLSDASKRIEAMNADFVDLNLGCPVPKVVKNGAGAAMCRNPVELHKILKGMVGAVKIPVAIKIRTGWDSTSRNALDVIHAAADAGVAWVAIHGRTRAQGYSGDADWDFISEMKAKSPIPIVGNGDIVTAEQAVRRYKESGVDAVWIGRGALRNPYLFEQASDLLAGREPRKITAADYLALITELKFYLSAHFNQRMAMVNARKFLSWYASGFVGCHEFRSKVFATETSEALWELALEFFEKNTKNRDFAFLDQPFLMGGHG